MNIQWEIRRHVSGLWSLAQMGPFRSVASLVVGIVLLVAGFKVPSVFLANTGLLCILPGVFFSRRWVTRNPDGFRNLVWAFRAYFRLGSRISPEYVPLAARIMSTWLQLMSRTHSYIEELQEEKSSGGFFRGLSPGDTRSVPVRDMPLIVDMASSSRGLTLRANLPVGFNVRRIVDLADVYAHAWGVRTVEVATTVPGFVDLSIPCGVDVLASPLSQEAWEALQGTPELKSLPVAFDEDGAVVSLDVTHTLFVGATGSGKGSGLWSVVRACLPAREAGNLRFFAAIDPKRAEFADPTDHVSMVGLFDRVAFSDEEISDVLSEMRAEMDARAGGRSFVPSLERPWLFLLVDEITSLFDGFGDAKVARRAEADLRVILSQGRSKGCVVIGAGQEATKERLKLRDLFPQRVAYRVANPTETGLVLGDTAVEGGAAPHRISAATPSNNYASAGLAWVRTTTGEFIRCRFVFTPDADIAEIARQWSNQEVGTDVQGE